jgi:hypothetical protein
MKTLQIFIQDIGRFFYAPKSLYRDIHEGRPSPSWILVSFYSLIYVAGIIILYSTGKQPLVEPWLKLDPKIYYLVEAFYAAPLTFLMWILAAGTIHTIDRLCGAEGSFDNILRMTGYSVWLPWCLLIPIDFLNSISETLYNIILGGLIIFTIGETALAARTEYKNSWFTACLASIIAVTSIGILLYTFIR